MRLCTKCRLLVNSDVLFCPKDGGPTVDASAEPNSVERPPSVAVTEPVKFAIGQVLCGLGGVLLAVLGGFVLLLVFFVDDIDQILSGKESSEFWTKVWILRLLAILAVVVGILNLAGAMLARFRFWLPLGLMGAGALVAIPTIFTSTWLAAIPMGLFVISALLFASSRERL